MNKQTFINFNTPFALLKETRNSFEKSPCDDRKRLFKKLSINTIWKKKEVIDKGWDQKKERREEGKTEEEGKGGEGEEGNWPSLP